MNKTIGIAVFVLGLCLTVFTSLDFFTKEKVVDLGAIQVTRDEPHNLNWSPLIGVAVMGLGAFVVWQASKK